MIHRTPDAQGPRPVPCRYLTMEPNGPVCRRCLPDPCGTCAQYAPDQRLAWTLLAWSALTTAD